MNPSTLTWDTLDWAALDRLRDTFLAAKPAGANYWMSRSDLDNYDFTFAQRIAWKWDAVLRELRLRGWTPPSGGPLLDWGCGSGIAGRRVAEFFGPARFTALRVFDHSLLAMEFAAGAARGTFPRLRIEPCPHPAFGHPLPSDGRGAGAPVQRPTTARPAETAHATGDSERRPPVRRDPALQNPAGSETGAPSVGTLVISHVLNELTDAGRQALRDAIDRAEAVLWVEPGTYADSRSLISMRETLRETFHVIAPCTHEAACGLRTPENERHWCHHFALPPSGTMADSNWVRFSQRAGIDLRSLPYSFLVLERKGLRDPIPGLLPNGYSRIIGEPRFYKGYAQIFSCQADGVRDLTLQKRDAPVLFKALKDGRAKPVWRWAIEKERILSAGTVSDDDLSRSQV